MITKLQPELLDFGVSIDDITKTGAVLADEFTRLGAEQAKIAEFSLKIGASFGVQAETVAKVVSEAIMLGSTLEDVNKFTRETQSAGIQVNRVFEDIAGLSTDVKDLFITNGLSLQRQARDARALGLNLNDIKNATAQSGGFQQLFTDELKASILLGKQFNFIEIERIRRQEGGVKALEKFAEQLTGTIDPAEQLSKLRTMDLNPEQLEILKGQGTNLTQLIKLTERKAFREGKGNEEFRKRVMDEMEAEKAMRNQLALQNKLSAAFRRIGIQLANTLLPYITKIANALESFLNDPEKVENTIKTIGNAIKYVAGSLVILKTAMAGLQTMALFKTLGGGAASARTPMFQNLFGGKQVRTKSGALDARFTRQNAIGFGAKFVRALGPAVTGFMVASDIFKAATTKDAQERRKRIGGGIGGVLGGIGGFFLGGPAGAAIGMGIGKFAGNAIGNYFKTEESKLKDLASNSASIIESGIRAKVLQRGNILVDGVKKALTDAIKDGGTFENLTVDIGKQLSLTPDDGKKLLETMGINSANFKDINLDNIANFASQIVHASGAVGIFESQIQSSIDKLRQESKIKSLELRAEQLEKAKKVLATEEGGDFVLREFAGKFLKDVITPEGMDTLMDIQDPAKFEARILEYMNDVVDPLGEFGRNFQQKTFSDTIKELIGAETFDAVKAGDANFDRKLFRSIFANRDGSVRMEVGEELLDLFEDSGERIETQRNLEELKIFRKVMNNTDVNTGQVMGNNSTELMQQYIKALNDNTAAMKENKNINVTVGKKAINGIESQIVGNK